MNNKTRLAVLLMLPLLAACASQATSTAVVPEMESDDQMQCALSCDYAHGGTVRACNAGRSAATRAAIVVEKCLTDSYATLRACYRACN
jgi:hypothetical protein